MRLSAIVLTLDAEQDLPACLEGLGFADEILVVDAGSTDRTREIATAAGARVLQHPMERFDEQRNWAQDQAGGDWLLFVDADERVPPELAGEIRGAIQEEGPAAYALRRRNHFLGKRIRHCGWNRDRVVRLLRRGCARWEGRVHERPRLTGSVGELRSPLDHHPYPDLSAYWDKLERYARLKALEDRERGRRAGAARITLHPMAVFLRMYVLRGGWMEGKHGLVLCLMSAFSSFTRAVRLWEMDLKDANTHARRPGIIDAPDAGGPPLTVLIPTFNEEENIEPALDSALWADEVLVVDSFSTDRTLELARRRAGRVLEHEYVNSAAQKNWALPQAQHAWSMVLDADERFTPELALEVRRTLADGPPCAGYVVRRVNYFLGRRIRGCGWNNDRVLRLFDRTRCRYQEKEVHAEVNVDGPVGELRQPLLHYTYRSVDQYWPKFRRYTDWGASQAYRDGRRAGLYHLLGHPVGRFFKMFVIRHGFLDGTHGLVISLLSFFSVFNKYAKLWELQRQAERPAPAGPAPAPGAAAGGGSR